MRNVLCSATVGCMTNTAPLPLPPERQSTFELEFDQRMKLEAVRRSMFRALRELMAARALGLPTDEPFRELEVLHAVEAREALELGALRQAAGAL